jgi:alkylation response protein AidB-like acyl-CoA dehydrogenase
MTLTDRLRQMRAEGGLDLPLPGHGATAVRHQQLSEIARKDLELARLAEAHTDATAILAEAGRGPREGMLYGVWASEGGAPLQVARDSGGIQLTGSKMFCTGAGLLDRALITVSAPEPLLLDVDLRANRARLKLDESAWKTAAFRATQTATVTFDSARAGADDVVGNSGWYLSRPGFWHGACGPAACWAGGALGLVDYALSQIRDDVHTLAHLGAMHADAWALGVFLHSAGDEIDNTFADSAAAQIRALTVRHLVEQACSDILRRLGRAYGPRPLAFDALISQRCQELELYIRQSHAERDLEALGRSIHRK